jgi:hypothetical protein
VALNQRDNKQIQGVLEIVIAPLVEEIKALSAKVEAMQSLLDALASQPQTKATAKPKTPEA